MSRLIYEADVIKVIHMMPPENGITAMIEQGIKCLPSAQPNLPDTNVGDMISRQGALKICRRYWHPKFNPIMEEIEKLPSVQPEIVWCKEGE